MAETTELAGTNPEVINAATEDMELENPEAVQKIPAEKDGSEKNGESNLKRAREEDEDGVAKKQKLEKSVEEERLENLEEAEEEHKGKGSVPVILGPKRFGSSVEMFDYFYNLLHHWPPNTKINKYEHTVLLELIKKGHPEPGKKIGCGISAFEIRNHPMWKSRCFFLIRNDDSVDDFSFRKCVDSILPLPEDMVPKHDANRALGGGKGHGGKGRGWGKGRGHGRGGRGRH